MKVRIEVCDTVYVRQRYLCAFGQSFHLVCRKVSKLVLNCPEFVEDQIAIICIPGGRSWKGWF
jgi:hypothetical protein